MLRLYVSGSRAVYDAEKPCAADHDGCGDLFCALQSGPAGLFCAYNLARAHQKVTLIERGKEVGKRKEDIDNFFKTGKLLVNSNVQFGEGGAGTFSDGKLTTGVKDKRKQFILTTLIK